MFDVPILLILIVIIALVFDYTNGAHDIGNAVAPVIATRALSPGVALILSAILNFCGAFLGTEVAGTIGKGIVSPEMLAGSQSIILAALLGAISWNLITWYFGIPSSSGHALIGSLMGAGIAFGGWNVLQYNLILEKVIAPLFISPVSGFIVGYILMLALAWLTRNLKNKPTNKAFNILQIFSSSFMSLTHGMNDAQKSMGIITLALFLFGYLTVMEVPFWVKLACASAISIGSMTGGWKIIKTMGNKIFKIEPIHGFSAQLATATVIMAASQFGAPISTTQVISSSLLGVGSVKRITAVKWGVAGNMVMTWFITIPCSALLGAAFMYLFLLFGLN